VNPELHGSQRGVLLQDPRTSDATDIQAAKAINWPLVPLWCCPAFRHRHENLMANNISLWVPAIPCTPLHLQNRSELSQAANAFVQR
jgi:hypothetical protein